VRVVLLSATLRQPADLARVFAAAGVDLQSPQPIVASCGSGVTACVVLLGMEVAGRKENVGLYDGSWTEWALRGNKITKTQ
jgi:thiosulfate/3-mercaptopyruvate sulfurtransferase